MKVFVAGATGAIGRPLIKSLTLAGHTTFGMVRSQNSSASLLASGAEPVIADALDGPSVSAAVAKVRYSLTTSHINAQSLHAQRHEGCDRTRRSRAAGRQQELDRGGAERVDLGGASPDPFETGWPGWMWNASPTAPPPPSPPVRSAMPSSKPRCWWKILDLQPR